jgi:hypothetical protein
MVFQAPVLYEEVYKSFIAASIPDFEDDWDNRPEGEELEDIDSVRNCRDECSARHNCFQFSYDGKMCTLGISTFRVGGKRKPEDGRRWQSGWFKKRIETWVATEAPCTTINFPLDD